MIRRITYLFGSSSVPQFSFDNHTLFQSLVAQCETAEKATELFELAGKPYRGAAQYSDVAHPENSDDLMDACVLLPLPWSTACCDGKIPFDTTLLNDPITVQVEFYDIDKVISVITGGTAYPNTSFEDCKIVLVQADLSDKGLSLKHVMSSNINLMSPYPFIHKQSYNSPTFSGDVLDGVSVNLTGFLNADLVGITFGVINQNIANGLTDGVQYASNSFDYEDILDIHLELNGQTLYRSYGENLSKIYSLENKDGALFVQNHKWQPNGAVWDQTGNVMKSFVTLVTFSLHNSYCYQNKFGNVMRVPNQTMNLSFKTRTTANYKLHATYYYNAVNEVQEGTSNIILN